MKLLKPLLFTALLVLASCSDDDDAPEIINEEEVITTLILVLSEDGGSSVIEFRSTDLDGDDGPDAPMTMSGILAANTTYSGVITALNEQEDPAENITEEVQEEDDEHQFFFQLVGDNADVAIEYDDEDADGNPLGVNFTLTTGAASTGSSLRVTLRHLLDKFATGVSEGDITNAGGSTDVERDFDIVIQ